MKMAETCVFADQTNRLNVARKPLPALVSQPPVGRNGIVSAVSKGVDGNQHCRHNELTMGPAYVPEYSAEIGDYLLVAERSHYRDPSYMVNQPEVTERMRMILVDWLVDVAIKFKLHPESFYLAIDIVDRYLCAKKVSRAKLQLVGISAILLSAKHEEIWPPGIKDCVFICANTYSAEEVFQMERDIALTLRFRFTVPTTYPLACHFLDSGDTEAMVRDATFFFLESASHNYEMLQYLPSRIAAASVLLGRLLVAWNRSLDRSNISQEKLWDREMIHVSRGITLDEIFSLSEKLLSFTKTLSSSSSKLQAIRRKYVSQKFANVASLEMPSLSAVFVS
ncbi:cyclin, putative [Trypanosoma cruzi]|uniref:Cyclin, putative n=2 Tax=Trypanosoma cruzi TaxID=5693 RepID=Q4CS48_TRYCC|nr:cyclin, putative [Trypanosoma cruzi]EAN83101.1 cyclin, putative [Trypanosoma cruzi]|eukprot:XP_804952.1 cyclin [Trypanosoma cruzi strain CL Brener]